MNLCKNLRVSSHIFLHHVENQQYCSGRVCSCPLVTTDRAGNPKTFEKEFMASCTSILATV